MKAATRFGVSFREPLFPLFLPLAPNPVRYDDNEKALARRMTGEDMPAPAFASKRFSGIILKMRAFDRDERYKTATEAKLEALIAMNPTTLKTLLWSKLSLILRYNNKSRSIVFCFRKKQS